MSSPFTLHSSQTTEDPSWDKFLRTAGQTKIEQFSGWAAYKKSLGWMPHRLILLKGDSIVAGAQILVQRKKGVGSIGYVSAGPVVLSDASDCLPHLAQQMEDYCRAEGISALLLAPEDHRWSSLLEKPPFLPNYVKLLIEGALRFDLSGGLPALFANFKRKKRQNIRRAEKLGVTFRQGGEEDLDTFYRLMKTTCQRKGVRPNPATPEELRQVWRLFAPADQQVLFLVDYQGEAQAALLCFKVGGTLLLWKKGWGGDSHLKVNDFLIWKTLQWAKQEGLDAVEDLSINADSIFSDEERARQGLGPRRPSDQFKQSFGGEVRLAPPSALLIPNPVLRFFYRTLIPRVRKSAVKRADLHRKALRELAGRQIETEDCCRE